MPNSHRLLFPIDQTPWRIWDELFGSQAEFYWQTRPYLFSPFVLQLPKNIEENIFVYETESIEGILKILKKNKGLQFITVLNTAEKPIGIIRESEIKNYLLSPFGQELLKKKELKELYQNIKVYDTNIEMSKIMDELEDDFVFITENNKYKGFLRKEIILELMKEIYA